METSKSDRNSVHDMKTNFTKLRRHAERLEIRSNFSCCFDGLKSPDGTSSELSWPIYILVTGADKKYTYLLIKDPSKLILMLLGHVCC